jgi:pyruvate kinase
MAADRVVQRLLPALRALREQALALEQHYSNEVEAVEAGYQPSARNLLHYLSLRQNDIRPLQEDLAALGLSSLGVSEPHALASLNAVIRILERLAGEAPAPEPVPPVDFRSGPLLLRDHARALLGPEPLRRAARIMVTMPTEAATNGALVRDLLAAGMDVMRINLAHDGPREWHAMVRHLREAEKTVGRSCRIQADLAGPKLRTGPIAPIGRALRVVPKRDGLGRVIEPARVWLSAGPGSPRTRLPSIPVDAQLIAGAEVGDRMAFRDARGRRRWFDLEDVSEEAVIGTCMRTAWVPAGGEIRRLRGNEELATGGFGDLPEVTAPILLKPKDLLDLTREPLPGVPAGEQPEEQPARIHLTLETAFECVRPGHRVWIDDGKIGGIVESNDGDVIRLTITHTAPTGARLKAEKGVNFPDTDFTMPALTTVDRANLKEAVAFADMIALSFLRGPEDVLALEDELHALGAGNLGIVLKIETASAFEHLPRILLASLRSPPVGVMVARGDLAVEVGFERLSEVQEEILWLCEAAHVPVIWATQVLEGMAKTGSASRAEVTDAAMSHRAECAMLNKGPNIVETVSFLRGILSRMETHQRKRRAMLRPLSVSRL